MQEFCPNSLAKVITDDSVSLGGRQLQPTDITHRADLAEFLRISRQIAAAMARLHRCERYLVVAKAHA